MAGIHIHAPAATAKSVYVQTCPDCGKRTRMLETFTPWYGSTSTCLKCGRQWADGIWLALEFSRFARKANIDHAKRVWRAMPPVSENHYGLDV